MGGGPERGRTLVAGGLPPAAAQTEQPTPAPSPTPAPTSTFRLPPADDGRTSGVQGPSDNGLPPLAPGERRGPPTPAPTPAPAPRTTTPTVVPTRPTPTPAPRNERSTPPSSILPSSPAIAPQTFYSEPSARQIRDIVMRVQLSLKAYGYYDGDIDGTVGPKTRDALKRFQTDYGLKVTGTITPEVLDAFKIST